MFTIHEFEVFPGESGMWVADALDMPHITQGEDFARACEAAADLLHEAALDALMRGERLPNGSVGHDPSEPGGKVVLVGVSASLADIAKVSATEAARRLGVSRPRVTAMVNAGRLEGWRDGRNAWVSERSLEHALENRGAMRAVRA